MEEACAVLGREEALWRGNWEALVCQLAGSVLGVQKALMSDLHPLPQLLEQNIKRENCALQQGQPQPFRRAFWPTLHSPFCCQLCACLATIRTWLVSIMSGACIFQAPHVPCKHM